MPIKIQSDLPAKEILERENIFVMDEHRALLDGLIECLGSVPQFLYVVCLRCHFMSVLAIDTQSNKTRQLFPTFFAGKTIFFRLGYFP